MSVLLISFYLKRGFINTSGPNGSFGMRDSADCPQRGTKLAVVAGLVPWQPAVYGNFASAME